MTAARRGPLDARERVEIRARVKGFLKEVHFKEGAKVSEGDLLYEIDPREYETALAQANANETKEQAVLLRATEEAERSQSLLATKAISVEEYQQRRDARGALWLGVLVLSHWVLDVASHRPDMPTWPGGPKLGAGLWYSLPGTLVVEFALWAAGLWLYLASTRSRDRLGSVLPWAFAVTLVGLYLGAVFGPPPPSVEAIIITGLLGWLFVGWAYWIDRHRIVSAAV